MQRNVRRLLVGLTAAIAVLSTAVDVRAQALPPERVFASKATGWSRTLDRVEDVLSRPGLALVELDEARSTARDVRDEAEEEAKRTRETARGLRGRLGRMEARPPEARPAEAKPAEPKPAAAPSPESEEVRVQLERLRLEVTNAEGAVKLAEDAIARAGQALDRIARLRGELVWAPLFRAGPSPLSPATWGKAGAEVGDAWRTLAASWRAYFAAAAPRDPARSAAGVVAFNTAFYGALALALVWLRRRVVRRDGIDAPSYRRRLGVAVLDIVSRVGLAVVAIRYATNMIDVHFGGANGEPTRPLVVFAGEAFRNVLLFLFVQGLAEASLTPRHPRWRIAPFSAESARLIAGRGLPLAAAVVALSILNAAIAPGEFAADHGRPNAEAILVSIGAIVVLLMAVPVLRADAWTSSTPGEDGGPALLGGGAWALGRAVIGLALAVVAAAALAGYAALADRVVDSIIATALLAFVVLVLRALASDLFAAAAAPASSAGRRLREAFGITASLPAHGRLLFLLAVDFALFCGVALTLPVLWGADTDDIVDRAVKLAAGVRIGERTISPLDVLMAVAVFAVVVLVFRGLRRLLRERVLPGLQVQESASVSIDAVANYFGVVIAVLLAVTALGVDFTSLALIVGALSVGIGLGLQNIANNTVSGLILLIERPVRVGERVTVGKYDGVVRRVNLRATEIETDQRATVIVPNSEFLQSAVVNWTHADTIGRLDMPVSVAHGVDVAAVEPMLRAVAAENPYVLSDPPPVVLFKALTPTAMEFELRVRLLHPGDALAARTSLNHALLRRLRSPGLGVAAS